MADTRLQPFTGQPRATLHEPGVWTKWDPSESPETFERYLKDLHDPAAPERFRLDDEWGYSFNSLGFRGEEYDPNAKIRIFACGCSVTFGVGVKWEQTWPFVFKRRLAARLDLPLSDINLLNFAQAGCSNDYIARTLVYQCNAEKPDLIIANFSYKDRTEFVSAETIENLGPWVATEAALNYYMYYTDELGMINALKNMLWFQNFAKSNDIPYLISFLDYRDLAVPKYTANHVVSGLIEMLDRSVLSEFSPLDFACDLGRPGHHPGPLSHELYADRFFELAVERLGSRLLGTG